MTRRMFSDEITTSDAFLDMPQESQLLYFHLGMNADDDGFIANTKMIQRIIGSGDDSLKILFAKKFLIAFENGVCVIKHWRINNYIRKDIYKDTKYLLQKKALFIRPNGTYSVRAEGAIPVPSGHFTLDALFGKDVENKPLELESDTTSTSRARNRHVGKDRIGKDSTEYTDQFEAFWNAYPKKVSKKTAYKSWSKITFTDGLFEKIMLSLKNCTESKQWKKDNGEFIPHPSTWLNQERWNDEVKVESSVGKKFEGIKETQV